MIVTLTTNPAIDRTIELDGELRRGEVQRAVGGGGEAGGKGVNVARALHTSGVETLAVFPAADDDPFVAAVRARGVPHRAVPMPGRVRTNITITEPGGTTTKLNEPGPELSARERERLVDAVVEASLGASWLVLAGSLPPATPPLGYARVIEAVRSRLGTGGPRIAVDTSGPALRDVLVSGRAVDLIKPNAAELAELIGDDAGDAAGLEADVGAAVDAARRALAFGCGAVLLTLGATGAVYVDDRTALVASPPLVRAVSTVGAGDASLAGFLVAHVEGADAAGALAQAVAHGAAAAALPGSSLPTRADTRPDLVRVTEWTTASRRRDAADLAPATRLPDAADLAPASFDTHDPRERSAP